MFCVMIWLSPSEFLFKLCLQYPSAFIPHKSLDQLVNLCQKNEKWYVKMFCLYI